MSSSSRKAAALQKLRAARNTSASDRLDSSSSTNAMEHDIYDHVDEDEYRHLVEARRQREDFVVDDDGLGYHDDGEERLGDEDGDDNNRKKRSQTTAGLTAKALKKVRKQNKSMSNISDSAAAAGNKSMWDFLNRGPQIQQEKSSNLSSSATGSTLTGIRDSMQKIRGKSTALTRSFDEIASELDNITALSTRTAPRRRTFSARRGAQRTTSSRSTRRPPRPVSLTVQSSSSGIDTVGGNDQYDATSTPLDYGVDDDDNDNAALFEGNNMHSSATTNTSSPEPSTTTATSVTPTCAPKTVRFADNTDTPNNDVEMAEGSATVKDEPFETPPPNKPRRPSRLNNISLGARRALEERARKEAEAKEKAMTHVVESDISVIESSNTQISECVMSSASNLPLQNFVQTDENNSQGYIDMFWMDMCERSGDIMLFGKVANPNKGNEFVSACALVQGNMWNLFFLPRKQSDGTYVPMTEVYKEVGELISKKNILPKRAGASWLSKEVKRSYAFGDPTLPREETEYLKVLYSAEFPTFDESICTQGGNSFSKILGAGVSTTENFIIKRQLMGPCWIRISCPVERQSPLSWCKLEFGVASPKNIKRLDLVKTEDTSSMNRSTPPVVTVTLKIKTATHPVTHNAEIVSLCAVCHNNVQLDSATDQHPKYLSQLSLIRPLGAVGSSEVPRFPRTMDSEVKANMASLKTEFNERSMLSHFLAQMGSWDPDVVVGHNNWGYDLEILIKRCTELKIATWSQLGRRRKTALPNLKYGRMDKIIADALVGRIICDTYLNARDLLQETTYSLTSLAKTQLGKTRHDVEPAEVHRWFENSKTIVQLAQINLYDAQLVQQLMFKLQILPLTKQLTCVAGNQWSQTLKSNRAVRTEYLLLHEFHRLKYLPPEKRQSVYKDKSKPVREKAKYSGGLVLEPKTGLYNSFILLLDFNSLYPSIIQEYNLCFTTIDWANSAGGDDVDDSNENSNNQGLPALPNSSVEQGVLPRVIKSLVDRRRIVKGLMKKEMNTEKKEELNIRQTALKLTANSMYGCLGFSNSRFFAQPIAALVTAQGRETLQRTVDLAQTKVGLDVIYGDTDSIMINTRISDEKDLGKVKELGERVKREVNKLYKTLELEIDGIFRTMLLLKKKKYAARTVEETPNGIKYGQELKGLDLVRRDWCIQSKESGLYVTEQILSGQDGEIVISNITTHLEELSQKMRSGEIPIEKYVINKGLSKHPNEYPDAKSQPHVQVAKKMLQENRLVNVGDHIPYIITLKQDENDGDNIAKDAATKNKSDHVSDRACHPDEVVRSNGKIKPDIEWYLTAQILPTISRLCDPIEGITQQELAQKLGLDSTRYRNLVVGNDISADQDLVDYTPASALDDSERFKKVKKLTLFCQKCKETNEFCGAMYLSKVQDEGSCDKKQVCRGDLCPNCQTRYWGCQNLEAFFSRVVNAMAMYVRQLKQTYYAGETQCDECNLTTRQLSIIGPACLRKGCHSGTARAVVSEQDVYTSLVYLECLFNLPRSRRKLNDCAKTSHSITNPEIINDAHNDASFKKLRNRAQMHLDSNAFNYIDASFWNVFARNKD